MSASSSPPPSSTPPPAGSGLTATFLRIGGRLRRMATQLLGSEAEADDALYEAFARLWQRQGEAPDQSPSHQEALLTTTVRHLSIDQLRTRQRHRTTSLDDPDPSAALPEAVAAPVEVDDESPEAVYARVAALMKLHLSPLQQHLLLRRDRDGVSYADLAAENNMQETAIRMQISRARRTIRELYRQENSTP